MKHELELIPADAMIAVLIHLPDHVLLFHPLRLVIQLHELLAELLAVDFTIRIAVELLEHAPKGFELFLLIVLTPCLLAARGHGFHGRCSTVVSYFKVH